MIHEYGHAVGLNVGGTDGEGHTSGGGARCVMQAIPTTPWPCFHDVEALRFIYNEIHNP